MESGYKVDAVQVVALVEDLGNVGTNGGVDEGIAEEVLWGDRCGAGKGREPVDVSYGPGDEIVRSILNERNVTEEGFLVEFHHFGRAASAVN